MIILDEHDHKWEVSRGDPSWPLVAKVVKHGIKKVVLTQHAIITGTPPPVPTTEDLSRLAEVCTGLVESRAEEALVAVMARTFLRTMELWDCCVVLQDRLVVIV